MTERGLERIVLGGRFGERPQQLSNELVACFAERGGRWVETAHAYAGGRAERAVGAAIEACDLPLNVITKVGHPREDGRSTLGSDSLSGHIVTSVERLGRPIDLVMLHRDDERAPVERLLEPVVEAVRSGLARRAGVSNWSLSRIECSYRLLGDTLGAVSLQISLVLPQRPIWPGTRAAEANDLRWVAGHGMRLLAWSPLARGWVPDPASAPTEAQAAFSTPRNHALLRLCDRLADRCGCSRSVIALAGVLARGDMIHPVVGAERAVELADAAKAVALVGSAAWTEMRAHLEKASFA